MSTDSIESTHNAQDDVPNAGLCVPDGKPGAQVMQKLRVKRNNLLRDEVSLRCDV